MFFCGSAKWSAFNLDQDEGDPHEENDEGQFRGIFFDLDHSPEKQQLLSFLDEDGERVFLRAGSLALIEVPLWVVDPDDDVDEDDEGLDQPVPIA